MGLSNCRALHQTWILFSCCLLSASAAAALPADVRALMKKHRISPDLTGIIIHRVGDRDPMLSHRPAEYINPASLTKLPLTFAAFDLLGPEHRWQTSFAHNGKIRNGVLHGDLILIGGGDPQLTAERFWLQVHDLRARGINKITGDLIIDDSYFTLPPHDPAAFDGAALKPYNAGGGALAVNFNAHRVILSPQANRVHAYVEPPNDNFVIDNKLKFGKTRCRNWRGRIAERYRGDENKITLSLSGRYARRCGEQEFYVSTLSHAANVAGVFGALWQKLGGEWGGNWQVGKAPKKAVLIAEHSSPPLSSIAAAMNKFSNNVIARNLFLSLPAASAKPPYTPETARAVFGEWMRAQGVVGEFYVDNGSGLSRDGRMSSLQIAMLLANISAHPFRAEIVASLPILGIDGTLKKRLRKSAPARGHLKTGSLRGVKNIAGFLRDENGQDIIFVCMMEKAGSRAKRFQDAMIQWALAKAKKE